MRVVLPSCAVNKNRASFPSASFAGFKYPQLFYCCNVCSVLLCFYKVESNIGAVTNVSLLVYFHACPVCFPLLLDVTYIN